MMTTTRELMKVAGDVTVLSIEVKQLAAQLAWEIHDGLPADRIERTRGRLEKLQAKVARLERRKARLQRRVFMGEA